jgi:hypothetical protein
MASYACQGSANIDQSKDPNKRQVVAKIYEYGTTLYPGMAKSSGRTVWPKSGIHGAKGISLLFLPSLKINLNYVHNLKTQRDIQGIL